MSAEVETMFSGNGVTPWHGIGTVLQDCPTSVDAIVAAGLDWTVEKRPALTYTADQQVVPCPGSFLVRSSDAAALGYTGDKYVPVQNRELFDFADSIIENASGVEARYETAGSLFGGRKVFLLLQLPDLALAGDQVHSYLFLTNTHAAGESLVAGLTDVRVVCNNTLQLALGTSPRMWRLRHTSTLEGRKAEAAKALGLVVRYNEGLESVVRGLLGEHVTDGDEARFFRNVTDDMATSESSRDMLTTQLRLLYEGKDDLQNFRGTKWGLYNAVADFVSNRQPTGRGTWPGHRQMDAFMTGERLLLRAEKVLRSA